MIKALLMSSFSLWSSPQEPSLVLWTWDRREDLSFIHPDRTKVAALRATLKVSSQGQYWLESRHSPYSVPAHTQQIAVFRLEISTKASVDADTLFKMTHDIKSLSASTSEIQLDFDATQSQRPFYHHLIQALRELGFKKISITALASWCAHERWLDTLNIDYAVPMVYNLGVDSIKLKNILLKNPSWKSLKCRGNFGLLPQDVEKLTPKMLTSSKIFIFNPHKWDKTLYETLLRKMSR